jgi:putative transposase
MNIVEKWTMPIQNWGSILDNLMIFFGDTAVKIAL